jgi:hypothetical protein
LYSYFYFQAMKKLFSLLCVLVLCQLSCDRRCGSGPVPAHYDVKSMVMVPEEILSNDPGGGFRTGNITPGDTVGAQKLVLVTHAGVTYYASRSSWPGNAVYACDPVIPGHKGTKEKIDSLKITSTARFDTAHPAGALLNDLFSYAGENVNQGSLATFLSSKPQAPIRMGFLLNSSPDSIREHRISIELYLSTGEEYRMETPGIYLQ